MDMPPEIERHIGRILILAGKPLMRRPIPAGAVLDALPLACAQDEFTCSRVRAYLQTYMKKIGLTTLRIEGGAHEGDSSLIQPNRHGEPIDSAWRARMEAYYQPGDFLMINAGAIAYDGDFVPVGSFISLGFDFAQLDIGYRDHWLAPLTDSSSLLSNEAATMPSVTISNWDPMTALGLSYEVFMAEMSKQDGIAYQDTTTSGKPRIAGMQISAEPVRGYAVGVNRISQYGGGARGGSSFSDFVDALLMTSNAHGSEETNRVASLTSVIQFPGRVPFAVYSEYAGEDNTYEGKFRLGATNFSLGLDFPTLWRNFDMGFEISEWQNVWYVHPLYPRGLTNDDLVVGHWFGDQRLFGDALGGHSAMLRAGWQLPNGDYAQARFRTMQLDEKWTFSNAPRPYETMQMLDVQYSSAWKNHPIEARLQVGRDIFGDSFARLAAAFDFAPTGTRGRAMLDENGPSKDVEMFIDAGMQYSRAREYLLLQFKQRDTTSYEPDYHVGVGARRRVSARNDIGVRVEFDRVNDVDLFSFRAVDYRFRLGEHLALTGFFGVGRYEIELPAYGYYIGGGFQYRNLFPGWDLALDYRFYDKMTRDKGLPSDPESNPGLPRRVIDVNGYGLYISKRW